MGKNLPLTCPSCNSKLSVKSLECNSCGTIVSGEYDLPVLASLSPDEQNIIVRFVKSSGSLKVMAEQLGLSYPTVRNLLDDIIHKIEIAENLINQNK
jgi:hypothetical protein